jgi:chromosome segregation ATPase
MSVQRKSIPPSEADLESTAELPVLDVAAYEATMTAQQATSTDTWVIPASALPSAPTLAAARPGAGEDQRIQIEADLSALAANLREVEEQLTSKGKRLVQIEQELAESRAERVAVEQRVVALKAELIATRAGMNAGEQRLKDSKLNATAQVTRERELELQLAERNRALAFAQKDVHRLEARVVGYVEVLQSMQGQRGLLESELASLDNTAREGEAQIERLDQALRAAVKRGDDFAAKLAMRERRLQTVEQESSALTAALAQRNEQLENSERAQLKLHESVAELTESLAARSERVIELEMDAVRHDESFGELQREMERLVRERDAIQSRATSLEIDLANANSESAQQFAAMQEHLAQQQDAVRSGAAGSAELQALLAGSRHRVDELTGELAGARRQLEERSAALRTALDAARAENAESEARLIAAEAELHDKAARIEELTKTTEEWRGVVEEAKESLAQRDSLIRRLEAETSNSAALLGNIQQSIKRMDPIANTGHQEIVPEGAVRLLIRAEGETEVVHVLSRKTTIGRAEESDLQIDAKFISRHHAVILAGPNYTIIEDLNSTNGVLVNNRRVTRHTLKDGDNVAIGRTLFRFAVRPNRAA